MRAVCLMGPTASGKTDLAIELCQRFSFEIISVDSAMVYRGLDIGSAKPSQEELEKAPHQLIDIRNPDEPYSAADFCDDAKNAMQAIHERGNIPLLVGGTMLYFKALQQGLSDLPSADPAIRERLFKEAEDFGWQALHDRLKMVDPVSAERIHPNDPQRLQRALEVYEITGQPMSALFEASEKNDDIDYLNIALIPNDRKWLHDRIEKRFHLMLEAGFLDEVRALQATYDLSPDLPSMRSVGYRQALKYLNGDYDEATFIHKGVVATRQLAKRQLTWLRQWPELHEFACDASESHQRVIEFLSR